VLSLQRPEVAVEVQLESVEEIDRLLAEAEEELVRLESRRAAVLKKIQDLKHQRASSPITMPQADHTVNKSAITNRSASEDKITLFMSLFKGRTDVYPRRFESKRSGKSGYQPACRHEWIKGVCAKPRVKCGNCNHRVFLPVTDQVIRNHLMGTDLETSSQRDFTVGVYPLLMDESCWFLAADFDKASWKDDVSAFLQTCRSYDLPTALERSRSGSGGHIWTFFSKAIPAALARQLGAFLLTETMERRPEIGLDSYDRFFPSQDTLPSAGLGSLIALPLQKRPREEGNSLFINEHFEPYSDQWAFLSNLRRMTSQEVEGIVEEAKRRGRVVGVRIPVTEEDEEEPWTTPPSRHREEPKITGPLPTQLELVLGNQIYVAKQELPPALRNRLIRIAAFQNPEFYRAQAMRLPTFGKPRIISCCEDFVKHIGIPRGCLGEVVALLESLKIEPKIRDKRFPGTSMTAEFKGSLRQEQSAAAQAMLNHDTGVLSATTAFGKTVIAHAI
jgi:hypothetical protein